MFDLLFFVDNPNFPEFPNGRKHNLLQIIRGDDEKWQNHGAFK